jgi:sugar lactone lactonase YvrE
MPDEPHALPDDPLIQYWDELIQGAKPASIDLDPEVVATIRRWESLDDAPAPIPAFVTRLREELIASSESTHPQASTFDFALTSSLNGLATWPVPERLLHRRLFRRPWLLTQIATAALLLLTLVASLMVFGLLHLGADRRLTIIPAVGTPPPVLPVVFVWSATGDPNEPLDDPTYPALDPQGNLWVPDGRNSRFQIFSPDGTLLEVWGESGSAEGQFNFMEIGFGGYGQGAITFDADGNFYVVDTGNYRVQKFGSDRRFLTAWGEKGKGEGQFYGITDIAVDSQGRVYVIDAGRGDIPEEAPAIQVFDADGRFLVAWGEHGSGEGQLIDPIGLDIDGNGDVWVADFGNDRVQKFSPDGTFLTTWGGFGVKEGQFHWLTDVAIDSQGRIYVTDWKNNRVQVFEPDGTFVAVWGDEGKFSERQMLGPNSLVLDGAGFVYVADVSNDTVQKYRLLPPLGP